MSRQARHDGLFYLPIVMSAIAKQRGDTSRIMRRHSQKTVDIFSIINPEQYGFFGLFQVFIEIAHHAVGHHRAAQTETHGQVQGIYLVRRNGVERVQYNNAFIGIAVCRLKAVQFVVDIDAVPAMRPLSNPVFPKRGAVAALFVAEYGGAARAFPLPRSVTAQAGVNSFVLVKIPYKKAVLPRMNFHINQKATLGIKALSLAKSQSEIGLLLQAAINSVNRNS